MKNRCKWLMILLFFGSYVHQAYATEFRQSNSAVNKMTNIAHALKQAWGSCFESLQAITTKIHDHCCAIPAKKVHNDNNNTSTLENEEGLAHIPLNPEDAKKEVYKQESILDALR